MKRFALIFSLAILTGIVLVPSAFAYGSNLTSLNNIPITDTLEEGTFEWDVLGRYHEDFARGRNMSTRLFGCLYENLEFGMSWGISRMAGPLELGLKYKVLDEYGGSFPISLAIGAEGITGNSERTGRDPTLYGVIGLHDLHFIGNWWDVYAGLYNNPTGFDTDDNGFFGGFKYWISDDLQFNFDVANYGDSEFVMGGGFNYDWANHLGFQGWVERDSATEENVFVLELAVRADMRDLTAEVSDPE